MPLKNSLALRFAMRQNTNVKSAAYQKWYAEVVEREGLSQRGLVNHIAEHCISVPKPMISAVIAQIAECIPELICQGVTVKLDGLGCFHPYVASKGVTDPTKFNVQTDVTGVRMRFLPEGSDEDNLRPANFKLKCTPELAGVFEKTVTRLPGTETDVEKSVLVSYEDWRNHQA